MPSSMTGYGQNSRTASGYKLQIDLKSVNHKYCEIVIRLPKPYLFLEDMIKKMIQQQIQRGRVECFISIDYEDQTNITPQIDWSLVDGYLQAAEAIRNKHNLTDSLLVKDILLLPGAVSFNQALTEQTDIAAQELQLCLQEVLEQVIKMRETEGLHLLQDMLEKLSVIEQLLEDIVLIAPQVTIEYAAKLKTRILELLEDSIPLDMQRIAMEVALLADRSSIDEELTRLDSHLKQFRNLLYAQGPVGRKLDFLIQEMNREANTIGSKANHAGIAAKSVELKAEMEKMREQAQNIE